MGIKTGAFALSGPATAARLRLRVEAMSFDGLNPASIRLGMTADSWIEATILRKSRLELIAEALDARLALITGDAAGYNHALAAHGIIRVGSPELTPAVYIARMGMGERTSRIGGNTSAKMREAIGEFEIDLIVADTDQDAVMRLLARDVARALEADPLNLGLTYVHDVTVKIFNPQDAEPETTKPYGRGAMTVQVTYRMGRGEI